MRIYLIRHSLTEGNLKKRYIGTTDEPLCEEGILLLKKNCEEKKYPRAEKIFVSPMKRCIQSAKLIYPGEKLTVIEELSECDFGSFENKNYEELNGNPQYQQWIDSGGTCPFPGGESREEFAERCVRGFERALGMCEWKESGCAESERSAAFIVHGGTIMSIMEKYALPRGGYYDFQIGNGEGYEFILPDSLSDFSSNQWSDGCADGGETAVPADFGISVGSDFRRSALAVSSGASHREADYGNGKNYQKLFS